MPSNLTNANAPLAKKNTVTPQANQATTSPRPAQAAVYQTQLWNLLVRGYGSETAIPPDVRQAALDLLQYQRWLQQVSAWSRHHLNAPLALLQVALTVDNQPGQGNPFYEATALKAKVEAYETKYWRVKKDASRTPPSQSSKGQGAAKRVARVEHQFKALHQALHQVIQAWPSHEGALSKDLLMPLQTLADTCDSVAKQIPDAIPAALHALSEHSLAPVLTLLTHQPALPKTLLASLVAMQKAYERLVASRLSVARVEAYLQRQLRKAQEALVAQQGKLWKALVQQAKTQGLVLPEPDKKATAAVAWVKLVRKNLLGADSNKPLSGEAYHQFNRELATAYRRWATLEALLNPPRLLRVLVRTPAWSQLAALSANTPTWQAHLPLIEYNLEQLVMEAQVLAPTSARYQLLLSLAHKVVRTILQEQSPSWSALQAVLPLAALAEPALSQREPIVKQLLQSVLERLQRAVLLEARSLHYVAALLRYSTLKPAEALSTSGASALSALAPVSSGKAEIPEVSSASPVPTSGLDSDDLVKILQLLQQQLQRLHVDSSTQTKLLGLLEGLTVLLNAMVDQNVSGIDDEEIQPLVSILKTLAKDDGLHPECRFYAAYAREALARVPTDTSVYFKSFGLLYRTTGAVMNIAAAVQGWDVQGVLEGAQELVAVGQDAKAIYDQHATSRYYEVLRLLDARFPRTSTSATAFLRFIRALAQQAQALATGPAQGPEAEAAKARAKTVGEGLRHEQVAYAITQRLLNGLIAQPEAVALPVYPWLFNLAGLAHSEYKAEAPPLSIGQPRTKQSSAETPLAFISDPRLPPLAVMAAYQHVPALLMRSKPSLLVIQGVYLQLKSLPAIAESFWLQANLSVAGALEAHYRQQLLMQVLSHLKSTNESLWRRFTSLVEKAIALDPNADAADLTDDIRLMSGQTLLAANPQALSEGQRLFKNAYQSEPAYWVELIEQQQRQVAQVEGEDLLTSYVPLDAAHRFEDLELAAKRAETSGSLQVPSTASLKEGKQEIGATSHSANTLPPTDPLLFNLREKLMRALIEQALMAASSQPTEQGPAVLSLIQAPAGAGKSSFGRVLIHDLWRFRQGALRSEALLGIATLSPEDQAFIERFRSLNVIPLFIKLGALADPTRRCIEQVLEGMGCSESGIQQLKKEARFIFFFDGYDEVKTQKNLYQSNALHEWRAQLIITCRLGTLGKDYQSLFTISGPNQRTMQAQEYYVAPFNEIQIQRYILQDCRQRDPQQRNWLRYEQAQARDATPTNPRQVEEYHAWQQGMGQRAKDVRQALQQLAGLDTLIKTPFVLKVILEVLPDLQAEQAKNKTALNRTKVYAAFVQKWYAREAKKVREVNLALRPSFHIEGSFQAFAEDFALTLMQHGRTIAPYLPDQYYSPEVRKNSPWVRFANQAKPEVVAARSGVPLTLTRSSIQFLHKSLLEYFTACALFQEVPPYNPESTEFRPTQWFNTLDLVHEAAVMDFLQELLDYDADRLETLWAMIKVSRDDPAKDHEGKRYQRMAANAATLLGHMRVSFSGKDLQRVRIPGANLALAILHQTDLRYADLSNVNLTQAWLRQANLQGATLRGVQFGERPYLIHEGAVSIAVYSPDGRWLATASDYDLYLWDMATGKKQQVLKGHTGKVRSVAFSPDGQQLAYCGSGDYSVQVWDIASGQGRILPGHTGNVTRIVFSPDGKQLASGSEDKTVRVWDIASGQGHALGQGRTSLPRHTGMVTSVVFSPDGKQLASCSIGDKTVWVWDIASGRGRILSGHTYPVRGVVFSPDSQQLASCSGDKTVRVWDSGPDRILSGHTDTVRSVVYSPDGKQLASCSDDNTVRVWDVVSGQGRILSGHSGEVMSVVFSPDGKQLASCGGKTVWVWDVVNGQGRVLSGHTGDIRSVVYSPDGQQLASSGEDKTVRVWDIVSDQRRVLPGHTSHVRSVVFNKDGRQLASCSWDKTVWVWDVASGQGRVLLGHTESVQSVVFSPDGKQLASGSLDKTVRVWDVASGQGHALSGHTDMVSSVVFSPNGQQLASCSADKTVRVWDVASGEGRVLSGHTSDVWIVVYSPDGKQLASSSKDKTVRVWDVVSGQGRVLAEHTEGVESIVFSPDGQLLVSGSGDKVWVWAVASGQGRTLSGHTSDVTNIVFSPDGKQLASGSLDYTVRVWDVASGQGRVLSGHTDTVQGVVFSPDGQQLASASRNKTIRVWDVASGRCMVTLDDYHNDINTLVWQGPYLITGGNGGAVLCWSLHRQDQALIARLHWRSSPASLNIRGCQIEGAQGLSPLNTALLEQRGALGVPALEQAKPLGTQALPLSQHSASFVANLGTKTGATDTENNKNVQASVQPQVATQTDSSTLTGLKTN